MPRAHPATFTPSLIAHHSRLKLRLSFYPLSFLCVVLVFRQRGRGGFRFRGGYRGGFRRGGGRMRGRGGFRGRGARPRVTREALDEQLDQYMAKSKGALDSELDAYMAAADD